MPSLREAFAAAQALAQDEPSGACRLAKAKHLGFEALPTLAPVTPRTTALPPQLYDPGTTAPADVAGCKELANGLFKSGKFDDAIKCAGSLLDAVACCLLLSSTR